MSAASSIFYAPDYLRIQAHKELAEYSQGAMQIVFALQGDMAVSLPQGLFGSVEKQKRTVNFHGFENFWNEVVVPDLHARGVRRAEIIHPPDIYSGFVPTQWLEEVGFSQLYADINHHISLKDFELHEMEARKLKQLESGVFRVEKLPLSELEQVHRFISNCREEKGLKINTPLERLNELTQAFPNHYDLFMAYLEDEPASAVITLQAAPGVVYYFLPGTPEAMKSKSPMVGLIAHLVEHYAPTHEFLDLGVSSIEGKPQAGLVTFKERMGGRSSVKPRFFAKV